jgi:hypothetical protein
VEVPIKYAVKAGPDSWRGIYEAKATSRSAAENLTIVFRGNQPNEYILTRLNASLQPVGEPAILAGAQAYTPFARSDYFLADLGLEFLHWPEQRLVRDAKITMRSGRPCKVLESANPAASGAAYTRVVSWIDSEYGFPIYAEAFGADGRKFKVFFLKGFKKVNGRWEPKELVIRNERTDSQTSLEFIFHPD